MNIYKNILFRCKVTLVFASLFLCIGELHATALTHPFIDRLLINDPNLSDFVLREELKHSERLAITYPDVKHKFLISYDIEQHIKEAIGGDSLYYQITVDSLSKNFSKINFSVPDTKYEVSYYFKGDSLVSPIYFYTKNWKQLESEYFTFWVSDTTRFNEYSMERLDCFVNEVSSLLDVSADRLEHLKKNKIYYILCRDEDEIEKVSGFRTRGVYILAYDYVVTTFNSHYHELLHLLINYKLENLELYTHPFFQEGFAVAFGGRGGKEPQVIRELGLFLAQSGMLDYTSLLTRQNFYQYDISLSYPVAGLYNYFLIKELGIEEYLKLYQKYSSSKEEVNLFQINENDLPPYEKWVEFLEWFSQEKLISFDVKFEKKNPIYLSNIYESDKHYHFRIEDSLLLFTKKPDKTYKSQLFSQLIPDAEYRGEKYFIKVNQNEVAIYNLFTNNLIANFVSSFSVAGRRVPQKDGYYEFSVQKSAFNEKLMKEDIPNPF